MKLAAAEKKKARIEIIPMIDTMFFLLVFFMISTLSMTLQKGMEVNLPQASSASDDLPEQVTLSIGSKGQLFFNKDACTISELELRLHDLRYYGEEPAVVINADEAVSHGQVIEVMDAVREAGIFNMAIATKPDKPST
ncbi:MAG: biopolymer transporter ExbD [Nitrospira sp.]|nr:biopolymer transporter ExbD [Nitrospira sp.]